MKVLKTLALSAAVAALSATAAPAPQVKIAHLAQ